MATIVEVRRANLIRILESKPRGYQKQLAEKIGNHKDYISQLKSKTLNYPMSNEVARAIEEAEGLYEGWMDTNHDELLRPEQRADIYRTIMPDFTDEEIADVMRLIDLIKLKKGLYGKHS